MNELFSIDDKSNVGLKISTDEFRRQIFTALLRENAVVSARWIAMEEPDKESTEEKSMDHIFLLDAFISAENQMAFIKEHCALTNDLVESIAKDTCGQFNCPRFRVLRKYRLTASIIGDICKAVDRMSYPKTFWEKVLNEKSLDAVRRINYNKLLHVFPLYKSDLFMLEFNIVAGCCNKMGT